GVYYHPLECGAGGPRRISSGTGSAGETLPHLLATHLQLCAATRCGFGGSAGSHTRFFCSVVGASEPPHCAQREAAITFLSAHGVETLPCRRTPPRNGD